MSRAMALYQPAYNASGIYYGNFLAHVLPISQALRQVAPRTTDTGQTNLATLQTNGVSNLVPAGTVWYEVFAFADALQATRPIYVRVEYSTPASTATYPIITITVGTATNGAGVLSGQTWGPLGLMNTAAGNANSGLLRNVIAASGDGSFLTLLTGVQANAGPASADNLHGIVIERTRDADGTPNANGYLVYRWFAGSASNPDVGVANASTFAGVTGRLFDTTLPTPGTSFDLGAFVPATNLLSVSAGSYDPNAATAQVYPVFGHAGPMAQGASKALAVAYACDMPRWAPTTLTAYGQPGTWLPAGQGTVSIVPYSTAAGLGGSPSYRSSNYNAPSPVFRWE